MIRIQIPLETGFNFLGWFAGHHWAIQYGNMVYEIGQDGKTKTEGGVMYFNFQRYENWCEKYKPSTLMVSTKKLIGSSRKSQKAIEVEYFFACCS